MNTTVVIPKSVYIDEIKGHEGRTIRNIEEKTKTKIRRPYDSNPADRKLTIYGYGSHAAADVDKAVDEILHQVNGRLDSIKLPPLEKDQLILSPTNDNAPERQVARVAQQQHDISDDDFVEILRWLHRFDLDGVQITSRKLRSLTENNQMQLRHLAHVYIDGRNPSGSITILVTLKGRTLSRTPIDVDRAVGYVSYAFIEGLVIFCRKVDDGSLPILPPREFLTAPDQHIKEICVSGGNMDFGRPGVLEETICGRRFEEFRVHASSMPDWQISDDLLRRLGRIGCAKVDLSTFRYVSPKNANFVATDDGILDYCFSTDLGSLGNRERTLWIGGGVSIGPTFFKKCVQAHFESPVTTNMELELHKSVPGYDVSGFLEHLAEYAAYRQDVSENDIRYDIPDQVDAMQLLIEFQTNNAHANPRGRSRLLVRRGRKNDEAFFLRYWGVCP